MRRSLLFPLSALLALVVAAPALAGGFATVGLSSTPEGVAPGKPRAVDITVLQHGRAPMTGLTPVLRIHSGGTTQEFAAKATGKPGTYRAVVVFPTAGRWSYDVHDGFTDAVPHKLPPVQIASAATPGDGIATGWLAGAGAALLLALVVLGVDRRRRTAKVLPHLPEHAA